MSNANSFYSNSEVLRSLTIQSLLRELWLVKGSHPSRRPLEVKSVDDLSDHIAYMLRFPYRGIVSVFSSVSLYREIQGLNSKNASSRRIGYDFFLDLDADNLSDAKRTTVAVSKILDSYDISTYKIKFSGRRGFHLTISSDCFNLSPSSFPSAPLLIMQFLKSRLKPSSRRNVKFDPSVYKIRQMMRLAYCLHQKSSLVALPLSISDVKAFKVSDAKPSPSLKVNFFWLELSPKINEAKNLYADALAWDAPRKRKRKRRVRLPIPSPPPSSKYRYIERLLGNPVLDGRHRLLWLVIAPYLITVKRLPLDDAKRIASNYFLSCSELKDLSANFERLIDYHLNRCRNLNLYPPSLRTLKANHPDLYVIVHGVCG